MFTEPDDISPNCLDELQHETFATRAEKLNDGATLDVVWCRAQDIFAKSRGDGHSAATATVDEDDGASLDEEDERTAYASCSDCYGWSDSLGCAVCIRRLCCAIMVGCCRREARGMTPTPLPSNNTRSIAEATHRMVNHRSRLIDLMTLEVRLPGDAPAGDDMALAYLRECEDRIDRVVIVWALDVVLRCPDPWSHRHGHARRRYLHQLG